MPAPKRNRRFSLDVTARHTGSLCCSHVNSDVADIAARRLIDTLQWVCHSPSDWSHRQRNLALCNLRQLADRHCAIFYEGPCNRPDISCSIPRFKKDFQNFKFWDYILRLPYSELGQNIYLAHFNIIMEILVNGIKIENSRCMLVSVKLHFFDNY